MFPVCIQGWEKVWSLLLFPLPSIQACVLHTHVCLLTVYGRGWAWLRVGSRCQVSGVFLGFRFSPAYIRVSSVCIQRGWRRGAGVWSLFLFPPPSIHMCALHARGCLLNAYRGGAGCVPVSSPLSVVFLRSFWGFVSRLHICVCFPSACKGARGCGGGTTYSCFQT